jgi:hypothetical protein
MMPACIKFPKAQDLTIETTITTSRLLANRSFALGETERSFLWETAGITCPARAIAWRRLKTTSARSTLQLRELLKKRGPCWVGAGTGSGLGLERVNQPTRFKKTRSTPNYACREQQTSKPKRERPADRNSIKFNGNDHRAGTSDLINNLQAQSGFECNVLILIMASLAE